jgi:hypothetical protein
MIGGYPGAPCVCRPNEFTTSAAEIAKLLLRGTRPARKSVGPSVRSEQITVLLSRYLPPGCAGGWRASDGSFPMGGDVTTAMRLDAEAAEAEAKHWAMRAQSCKCRAHLIMYMQCVAYMETARCAAEAGVLRRKANEIDANWGRKGEP